MEVYRYKQQTRSSPETDPMGDVSICDLRAYVERAFVLLGIKQPECDSTPKLCSDAAPAPTAPPDHPNATQSFLPPNNIWPHPNATEWYLAYHGATVWYSKEKRPLIRVSMEYPCILHALPIEKPCILDRLAMLFLGLAGGAVPSNGKTLQNIGMVYVSTNSLAIRVWEVFH